MRDSVITFVSVGLASASAYFFMRNFGSIFLDIVSQAFSFSVLVRHNFACVPTSTQ